MMLMPLQLSCGKALAALAVGVLSLASSAADAQSVEDFYRGKTINMVLGFPGGGSNDIYLRSVARHIVKHIPGKPTSIVRNMPGGGSLVAANYLFNVAPQDGTVMALISATIPLEAAVGAPNIKFDPTKFNWIGRIAPNVHTTFVMASSPVKTLKDTFDREVILGATGRSATVAIYPAVLAKVIGAKFKLVMEYAGSNNAMLAMERGEVDGHSTSLETVRGIHPDWMSEKKITVLVQYALKRHPEIPDVPTSWELARTEEEREVLRIVANATEVGKMIMAPPNIPANRVYALRRAFDATVKDPEFVADLKAARIELGPMIGEELQKLVSEAGGVPLAILDKVKAIYPLN
jgi:tripartite-type tricarboxylate transporter receptor subunit TctC